LVECVGRDPLVGLLLDQARARVTVAHASLLVVAGVATASPIIYVILRG